MLRSLDLDPRPEGPTIFFFAGAGERAGLYKRRSALAGFRAVPVGGVLMMVLTVALQPATDVRGCSNYGGNGNGTAFSDGIWDFFYPLLLFSWLVAVIVEQLLPVIWNGREATSMIARAVLAVTIVVVAFCGAELKLLALCL